MYAFLKDQSHFIHKHVIYVWVSLQNPLLDRPGTEFEAIYYIMVED